MRIVREEEVIYGNGISRQPHRPTYFIQNHLSYSSEAKNNYVNSILKDVPEVTADIPGFCDHTLHDVQLIIEEKRPIRQRAYRINPEKTTIMKKKNTFSTRRETSRTKQLSMGITILICPQAWLYTFRHCVNYRKLKQRRNPSKFTSLTIHWWLSRRCWSS